MALAFGLTTVLLFFGIVLVVIGSLLLIVGVDIYFFHIRPKKTTAPAAQPAAGRSSGRGPN